MYKSALFSGELHMILLQSDVCESSMLQKCSTVLHTSTIRLYSVFQISE